jgi:probable HAF family extracellular repeat protein
VEVRAQEVDMTKPKRIAAWTVATLAALPLAAMAAPPYVSVEFASGKYAAAVALNDAGRFAVNNFPPDIPYEVAYISGSPQNEDVGSLGGNITRIRSLNDKGEAVGESTTADGALHAFLYSSGRMHDLTAAYGVGNVHAIDNRGDVSGQTADGRAMVIRNGTVDAFGPPGSSAGALNDAGDTLVEYAPPGQGIHTAVYSEGTLTDLPLLGGAHVFGSAINDAGWVTGYGFTAGGRAHAFLYDGRTISDLTPAASSSAAYDINDMGAVVGTADNRAFLYANGKMIDLNSLVDPSADLLLTSAIAINDQGQILAKSCDRAGVFCYETVRLDAIPAVPQPPQIMMWLAGLAWLSARWAWRVLRRRPSALPAPGSYSPSPTHPPRATPAPAA